MTEKYEVDEIVKELIEEKKGVKDLLIEMKDISELMVDLAYSAVLFNNDDLANEVKELEEEMNKLRYQIEIRTMLATKNPADAAKLAGILKIASAAENISNAADRMATIVLRDIEIHPVIRAALQEAREIVDRIIIGKRSKLIGKKIKDLKKEAKGVIVNAMKKDSVWIIKVPDNEEITENDHLIVAGARESIEHLKEIAK